MTWMRLLMAGLVVVELGGCVAAPVPLPEKYVRREGNRTGPVAEAEVAGRADATTRRDVVLKLGEPDWVWDDERYFAYVTAKEEGAWAGARLYGAGYMVLPGPMWVLYGDHMLLLIEFDRAGQVVRQETLKGGGYGLVNESSEVRKVAMAWASEHPASGAASPPAPNPMPDGR